MSGTSSAGDGSTSFLSGDGEMSRRTREYDWSSTPVGPIDTWPQGLKTAVQIMLGSRYAMWLGWGPEFTFFYNAAYAKMTLGPKHPWALGKPAQEVWSEIWEEVGPRAQSVLQTGEATWDEGLLLFLERRGFPEESYHTFSYSPLPGDDDDVGGMLCVVTEDTEGVIGERRLKTLRELAARTIDRAKSVEEACENASEILAENNADLPFSLIYLLSTDGRHAHLAGVSGVTKETSASPATLLLDTGENSWPLLEVIDSGDAIVVENLSEKFGEIGRGPWPEATTRAMVLPLATPGQAQLAGFLIAGLSPRLPFDDKYRGYLDLLAGQIAATVANARAYAVERERADALAELDRAKTAFFSNVSHEFRTPLTLMLGPVEDMLSRSYTELSPAAKGQLEVVNRNGLRLLRLVNSLLDFSRIEAGRVRATFVPTNLAAFTQELASVFRSAVERAGLRLEVECLDIPEPVYIDREMWEKIVLNLLSNAFKFTFEGEIAITQRHIGDAVELAVRDTGTGIPSEQMPRLFERFHRIENAQGRTHEGSGIGLALVQELVKLHRGTISATSKVGEGTTFTIRIPLGTNHLPADQVGQSSDLVSLATGAPPYVEEALRWLPDEALSSEVVPYEEPQISSSVGPLRETDGDRPLVLVADDNSDMRQYIARLLSERFRVTAVADGRAALLEIRKQRPDLVLTDIMMPRMDGFALLQELRGDPRTADLPIIMLSARAGEESRVEGVEAGADDYLVKPFSARELLARVGAHLQMARMRIESAETLRQNEERLQMALRAARMVAWQWNLPEDSVVVSENAATVFGLRHGTTIASSRDIFALCHTDDVEQHKAAVLRAVERGASYVSQFRMLRPDNGELMWLEERGRAVTNASGATERLIGVVMDITIRKQAEDELQQERDMLSVTLASIGDAVITTDNAACVANMNPVAETLTGWSCQDAKGQPLASVFRIVNEQSREPVVSPAERALREGIVVGLANHTLLVRKDGSECPIDDSAAPIRGEAGTVVGAVLVFRDVTQRRQAEKTLRVSEAHFRAMANEAPTMLWVTEADGSCSFLSRGWYEYTGQTENEGLGKGGYGWLDAVHPDDRDESARVFQEANAKHHFFSLDYRVRQPDGSYRWAIDCGRPRFDERGEFLGFIGSVNDVHERKLAQEFRARQTQILEMAASEQPLANILKGLTSFIEWQIPGSSSSILLFDEKENRLRHGAAPNLSQEYNAAIDGIAVGPNVGSCGSAIHRGQRVVVEDIQSDPLWNDFKALAAREGLGACWSQPIRASDGRLLGTTAIYFPNCRAPAPEELAALESTAHFAGIAIERPQAQAALRESEERFRALTNATSDVVYSMSADWTDMRHLDGREFLVDTPQPRQSWLDTYIPPEDRAVVEAAIRKAVASKSVFELEHRVLRADGTIGWTYSRAIPMVGEHGEILEWFGAASDVTQRREIEEKLRKNHEELARFNRSAVGREIRMIELKKMVNELCQRLGEPTRFPLDFDINADSLKA